MFVRRTVYHLRLCPSALTHYAQAEAITDLNTGPLAWSRLAAPPGCGPGLFPLMGLAAGHCDPERCGFFVFVFSQDLFLPELTNANKSIS